MSTLDNKYQSPIKNSKVSNIAEKNWSCRARFHKISYKSYTPNRLKKKQKLCSSIFTYLQHDCALTDASNLRRYV